MKKINFDDNFDAVVIGAGHAGCESALALARLGKKTCLTTISLDAIAFLACNPSIGGTAKGHLVCEIDALGGEMGKNADATMLQLRMLNQGKGPAVHSLRAQVDKNKYHERMKKVLEENENITIKQAEIVEIYAENNKIVGVRTALGENLSAKVVVVATGVYLKSQIIIGNYMKDSGPNGYARAEELSDSLIKLGHELRRFKTGTPARLNSRTIDFSELEIQGGEKNIQHFSFDNTEEILNDYPCYVTYTNSTTHKIIRDNIHRAPLYSGLIHGIGPRYCPSIEDKVVRFPDRERHQLFLEPEALSTNEIYVQGCSTSLPFDVQKQIYHSIKGLENAQIMRYAYAIEYDAIDSQTLKASLESKFVDGLFFAGQINGTSGYEEAAAQGIIAGINANQKLDNKEPLVLGREQSYIGVLIDDLITKGTNEPYRMMTSRAEFRLVLRQDNADERLTPIGRTIGLVTDEKYQKFMQKREKLQKIREKLAILIKKDEKLINLLTECGESIPDSSMRIKDLLKRNNITIFDIKKHYPEVFEGDEDMFLDIINTEVKYEGYINQQKDEIEKLRKQEQTKIPEEIDYDKVKSLRIEARQKLSKIRPETLGMASRISGVSPADITVLSIYLKSYKG